MEELFSKLFPRLTEIFHEATPQVVLLIIIGILFMFFHKDSQKEDFRGTMAMYVKVVLSTVIVLLTITIFVMVTMRQFRPDPTTEEFQNSINELRSENDEIMHALLFGNDELINVEARKKYYAQALNLFRKQAQTGSREAHFLAGYVLDPSHKKIIGVEKSEVEAINEYTKAGDHAWAKYCLGILYEDNGNYEKAKNCYEYAASHGISDAEQKLKNMRYKKQIK